MNAKFFILIISLFLAYRGFSFIYFPPNVGLTYVKLFGLFAIIYYLFFNSKLKIRRLETPFNRVTLLLMLIPFLGIIPAFVIHHQSFMSTITATMVCLGYFLFFILWKYKFKESDIVKAFFYLAVVWCLIEIVELNSSIRLFVNMMGDEELSERNDILRLRVAGVELAIVSLFYVYQKYLETSKSIYLFLCFFFLVGIYLTLTRQLILSSILCLFVGAFLQKKKRTTSFIVLLFLSGIFFLFFFDAILGKIMESLGQNISDDDYVRYLAFDFYGIQYNGGKVLPIVLGNGCAGVGSAYHQEIVSYQENYFIFLQDIGLVGDYFYYGVIYVFVVIYFFYIIFKNRKYIDLYLLLSVLQILITCPFLHQFTGPGAITRNILLMYLISQSIMYNKQKNIQTV